jgi:hypothetical protein
MPDDYYRILGLCCFLKDALVGFYEAAISGQYQYSLRDRHVERYLDGINANSFTYQHRLQPIERANIDPTLLYARSLLIQFTRAIYYSNLPIYQNLQTGNVWIDITQFSPYGPNYNPTELDPSWWRFGDESEPKLKKTSAEAKPPIKTYTRHLALCSSDLKPKLGKKDKARPNKIKKGR